MKLSKTKIKIDIVCKLSYNEVVFLKALKRKSKIILIYRELMVGVN